ncbi:multi-sensor hybrid histidine kinase [Enhygromyxa salina]|uniref:histidine kinase n=1 Tax=Enhygromyxa salina TaxID=215803 RepID=A0A0C2D2K2_9BACT|nr:PAS domain-containing sensor histidine kinase [Enhygromyxa salina]KIG17506.1 multi-sensor hybrid histidine kinase [Enhygromyxa salina]
MREASGEATRVELLREIATLREELRAFREARLGSLRGVNEHFFDVDLTADHIKFMLDSSPVGVGISRISDSLVVYQNERCAQIFGVEIDEVRYANDSWVDPAERAEFVGAYTRGEPLPDRPARMRRKDNAFIWALLTFEPLRLAGVDCVLFWIYDVTQLRAAHLELERTRDELELRVEARTTELARSEGQLRTILDSLADAVLVCDAAGGVIHWNAAAASLCATAPRLGAPLAALMGPVLGERLCDAAHNAILQGRSSRLGDAETADAQGLTHLLDIVVSPTRDENTEPLAVFVLRDVTEQRRLEMQVQHAARMDSLGQLSGGIAHDFNNMLNGIMGAAELLGLESSFPPNSPPATNLKLILDTAGQAAELTRKLLAFSRTDAPMTAVIDIHEPIRDAVAILHHSVDKRVEISVCLDAEQATIRGDKVQIQNALLNLGINANQAMSRGGVLEIVTKSITLDAAACAAEPFALEPGPYVEILVRDTGIGMDETLQAKIFEPFFTTKEFGRGTGLGLSMVYGTVESHGGAISVTSELGAHTTFRLLFPFHQAEPLRQASQPIATLTQALRVLIVDDERSVRRTLAAFFSLKGGTVLEASDGHAGLELIERHVGELDLVILDTVMPRISGADCLRRLRELAPNLPVVMISGHLRNVALRDLEDLGIGAFLGKPFRFAQLGQAVQQAMSGARVSK